MTVLHQALTVDDAIELSGDHHAIGYQHGQALAGRIRSFLDDGLARLNHILHRPTSLDALRPMIDGCRAVIAEDVPELHDEIVGLAAGAGISVEEATLLQIRREILGYSRIPAAGDCTTLARRDRQGPVLAQTVDLNGALESELAILRITPSNGGNRVLLLTFTGLLGYLGINDRGVAIGLNLVLGGDWRAGVPPYLAIRHLLDTAATVDDCRERLSRLRLASSRSLTICDRAQAVTVEILGDRVRTWSADPLVHTNHYLDPDLADGDEINVFARNGSVQRLDACRAALTEAGDDTSEDGYFAILARHPICVHPDGNLRREATVAAAVMRPAEGRLHVRRGNPCISPTRSFAITPA